MLFFKLNFVLEKTFFIHISDHLSLTFIQLSCHFIRSSPRTNFLNFWLARFVFATFNPST